jgi:hypothetical protein
VSAKSCASVPLKLFFFILTLFIYCSAWGGCVTAAGLGRGPGCHRPGSRHHHRRGGGVRLPGAAHGPDRSSPSELVSLYLLFPLCRQAIFQILSLALLCFY